MVAMDFSAHAMAAADYAAGFAASIGADILLVNVLNQRDVDAMNEVAMRFPEYPADRFIKDHLADRKERLAEVRSRPGFSGLQVKQMVKIGVPYDALLKTIGEEKPELLVMGTLGRSAMMDALVGSCARKMFRRCPIPLLTIRNPVDD